MRHRTAFQFSLPRRTWRIRDRLTFVVTVAAAAPALAIAIWFYEYLSTTIGAAGAMGMTLAWVGLVLVAAAIYGSVAARRLVGPLERLSGALREFDVSLGDAGHPALRVQTLEPVETANLKKALQTAVERVGRERAQKEAVLAGLMHDLKTPLVAQDLLVNRLAESHNPEQQQVIVELRRSTRGAVARLNRLIDVLRVDSAVVHRSYTTTNVRELVDVVLESLAPLIAARGVAVQVEGAWTASIDTAAVTRAVENVVANAIRMARSRVDVGVHNGLISIADDGPGFSEPFDELLDPFRPGKAVGESGTAGLGLYVARRSLEASGGRLKLGSSQPGTTTVLLYLGSRT